MPVTALGNVPEVAIERGAPICRDSGCVAEPPALSATRATNENAPEAVGVPLSTAPFSVMPAGRPPAETVQAYAPEPPAAVSVWL